jgi:hypothetical protein
MGPDRDLAEDEGPKSTSLSVPACKVNYARKSPGRQGRIRADAKGRGSLLVLPSPCF